MAGEVLSAPGVGILLGRLVRLLAVGLDFAEVHN